MDNTQVAEKIDGRILRILGLEDVFDLDYETYSTLIREELIKVTAYNKKIPTEEFDLLRSEAKRVRGKKGRFKVKKTGIKSDKITNVGATNIGKTKPMVLSGKVALRNNVENVEEDKHPFADIRKPLDAIFKLLTDWFKFDRKKSERERISQEDEKRNKRESKLEGFGKGIKSIVSGAKKLLSPFQGLIDRIFRFLFFVFLGRMFTKFMNWMGDKKNQKKLEALGRFLKAFWPAIAAAAFLFLTPFGKFVRGTIGFLVRSVPKIFKLIGRIKKFGLKDAFKGLFGGGCGCSGFGMPGGTRRGGRRSGGPRVTSSANRPSSPGRGAARVTTSASAPSSGGGALVTMGMSSGGRVGSYAEGGKVTGSSGIPITGAGRDNRLKPANVGDVILTPEDQKKISSKIGGDIGSVLKGPGKQDKESGTQLIAVRPGERRLTPDDQQKLYEKTGFDAAAFVSDRKPKLVSSNNIKMPGQQQAMSLGGIVQGFTNGGVVGGQATPQRPVATPEYNADGTPKDRAMANRGPNAPGANKPISSGSSGEMAKWDFSKGGQKAETGDGECTKGVILTGEKNKVNIGHPSVATGNDINNPRGLMAQAITKFGWGSIPGLGRSRQIKSPYGNGNVLSMNWKEWIAAVQGGKIPSGAMIFSTKKGWDYSGGSTGNDSAIAQDNGKKLWSGHWQYQYENNTVGGVYGPATKEVVALSHPAGNAAGASDSSGGGGGSGGADSGGGSQPQQPSAPAENDFRGKLMVGLGLGKLFGFGNASAAPAGSSDTSSSSATSGGSGGGPGGGIYAPILDLIAKYEAGSGGWESMYPSTKLPGATKMTISEVASKARYAVGMYQNLPQYLVARAKAVGLNPDKDLYNEENQRKIAVYLIEKGQAGVTPDMLSKNPDDVMTRLAKVWAAIPVPKDMRGASRNVKRGESYYAGVGSNKAHITPEMMYEAIKKSAGGKPTNSGVGDPPASENAKLQGQQSTATTTSTNSNIIETTHPDTGPGWTIKGVMDVNNRPAVFSKGGAEAFAKMMQDSKGVVKGSDIHSSKRSPEKNASLPGAAKNSNHLSGNALDIHQGSQTWMRKNGAKYGWVINDYPGTHGGHFDYKGSNANVGSAASTTASPDSGSSTSTPSSGGGGGGGIADNDFRGKLMKALGLGKLFGSSGGGSTTQQGPGAGSTATNGDTSSTPGSGTPGEVLFKNAKTTYYDPSLGGINASGYKTKDGLPATSTGEGYRPNVFSAAAFPPLIAKLPDNMKVSASGFPGGKTLKTAFNVIVENAKAKKGNVRVNDVGPGVSGHAANHVLDLSVAAKNYLGTGEGFTVYMASSNKPGPIEGASSPQKMIGGGGIDFSSSFSSMPYVPENLTIWAKKNRKMIEKSGTKKQKEILAKVDMQEAIHNSFTNKGLLDIGSTFGSKYAGSAADNRLLDFGGKQIAAQPGEQLFSYMIPKQAANKGAGDAISEFANRIVAQLDSNSAASKQLGKRNQKTVDIQPYAKYFSEASSSSSDGSSNIITLPPIYQTPGSNGVVSRGGTKEVMFSPICPAGAEERRRLLDTYGVLV